MPRSPLVDIALGYMPAQVVYAAAELGLADLLSDGPRSCGELAADTQTHQPSLRRLLRALAALGIVVHLESDRFELTELGGPLRSDAADSVRSFVTMLCERESWQPWGELVSSVRSGEPAFDQVMGVSLFEYLGSHPVKAATFAAAMSQNTREVAPGVIAGYDFARFGTILDVGGGDGTLLAEILRSQPEVQGVLFDLPTGLGSAETVLGAAGVADRCRVVPGDFFVSVPDGADAYLMKSVLHDWDDDRAVAILHNCRQAMIPEARVLIVERVLPELATPDVAEVLMIDLYMLIAPGGRERTEVEYRDLLTQAGFAVAAISDPLTPFADRVIEAAPT